MEGKITGPFLAMPRIDRAVGTEAAVWGPDGDMLALVYGNSDWSVETCFEQVAEALRNGWYYGYDPTKVEAPPAKALGKKQAGKATVPSVSSSHLA